MIARAIRTSEADQNVLRVTLAFLSGRLAERGTVEWALRLAHEDEIKRLAILQLLDTPEGRNLSEPWRSAWRLIEESWNSPAVETDHGTVAYRIQGRLRIGDRSGALVGAIAAAVAPRLKAEPFSDLHVRFSPPPKRPKHVEDLFSVGLTSGRCLDLAVIQLDRVTEKDFLASLATTLASAVENGLDIARRLGWHSEKRAWRLSNLHRVYYVPAGDLATGENEPDRFARGIAPSVKLLHAVVARLLELDLEVALAFVHRWKPARSPIHLRLWSAMARDTRVARAEEVATLLLELSDEMFWNLHTYPEIAELRARRFAEIAPQQQALLIARIRKRPPRKQWPRSAPGNEVESARLYWAVRELRRLELAGATLPRQDKAWLEENIRQFPELIQMASPTDGFLMGPTARWVAPNPDEAYDAMAGVARLQALEDAFGSPGGGWNDDPSDRASAWIRDGQNPRKVLDDFETTPEGGAEFPKVLDQFGWAHSPKLIEEAEQHRDATHVFLLLVRVSDETLKKAIDGVAHWYSTWKNELKAIPGAYPLWLRLWRIAADATNATPTTRESTARVIGPSNGREQALELDTLNTGVGKLVDVFLAMCANLEAFPRPFETMPHLRELRDAMVATPGRAGLIARARLIESVHYFLSADRAWTNEHLLTPLRSETAEALALWRAVAHRPISYDVLQIIGDVLAERAVDVRLDRETRQMLVFSLVVESLFAFKKAREPAVPNARIQQTIRNLEDEVRAYAADTVRRFVVDLSQEPGRDVPSPEELFRTAAAPFLREVWPLEHSLATPGVSHSFADLPAACGDAFPEAVDAVARFLVPFDCWSMLDYGLYGEEDGEPKLSRIDSHAKAEALLRLLDRTIGTSPGATIPHDLSEALSQITRVAPQLAGNSMYRRLATLARRV